MGGKVLEGPVTIRGDLIVTGRLNKGSDTVQQNNGQALQIIQGVLQPVVTQPNTVPQSGDVRMYGQNVTINGNVVPGGTDGYFQIDEYINGGWQHLFEIQPSTTGNSNVLDLFISGRLFARDSLLSAPGRFFFKPITQPFGANTVNASAYGVVSSVPIFLVGGGTHVLAKSTDNGKNWSSITNSFSGTIQSLYFTNGVFLAGDDVGNIARSSDGGATWINYSTPFGAVTITSFAYGNGQLIVTATANYITRSQDFGATWNAKTGFPFAATSIAFGSGNFVVVGYSGSIRYSTDSGQSWNTPATNPFAGGSIINQVAFGNGVFVAVANNGTIARSIDGGINWTLVTNPFAGTNTFAISFGSGIFIVTTTTGNIARSLDLGLTWGVLYGDGLTVNVLSTYGYTVCISNLGKIIVAGRDATTGIPIVYSDYVEAGAGIVESGSNSNGSFIQFADGTMECRYTSMPGQIAHAATLTFPVPFIAAPESLQISGGNGAGNYDFVQWYNVTASSFQLSSHDAIGGTQPKEIRYFAQGRWK